MGLVTQEVGAEVLLVVVSEDGGNNGIVTKFVLRLHVGQKVGTRADADCDAQLGSQSLSHQDAVAVADGDHGAEVVELEDGGDELVGDTLDAMVPTLQPVERVGDSEGSTGKPVSSVPCCGWIRRMQSRFGESCSAAGETSQCRRNWFTAA